MSHHITHTDRLKRNPKQFRQLTGVTPEKFDWMLKRLVPVFERNKRNQSQATKRSFGGGRKYGCRLEDRLLMTLMYYRTYTSQTFLGFLFQVNETTISRNVRRVAVCLAGIFRIPERKITLTEGEIAEIFFDGTEQTIQRPQKKQRRWYSGKKKRHTIKHQVAVVKKRKYGTQKRKLRIAAVSKAYAGQVHDKRIYDESRMTASTNIKPYGDSGYQGTACTIPIKKPKGGALTARQKQYNTNHSRKRIVVEHGIGNMKQWQILAQRFRNRTHSHDVVFKNIAGLANLMYA